MALRQLAYWLLRVPWAVLHGRRCRKARCKGGLLSGPATNGWPSQQADNSRRVRRVQGEREPSEGGKAAHVTACGDYREVERALCAEGALDGMANVVSAQGSYNLQTSEAAINMTQAQSQEIADRQQYANTYYQMRAQHDAYIACLESLGCEVRTLDQDPDLPDCVFIEDMHFKWLL